jgi:hypothetical protein
MTKEIPSRWFDFPTIRCSIGGHWSGHIYKIIFKSVGKGEGH